MLNPRRIEDCAEDIPFFWRTNTSCSSRSTRDTRVRYIVTSRHRAGRTPRGRERRHVIKYTLVRQRWLAKWLTGALVANSVALRRGCSTKKHVLNQSIAALRRSVGLLCRFVTVWKKSEPDTNTPSYCNPAAHARQGLIVTYVCCAHASASNACWCYK